MTTNESQPIAVPAQSRVLHQLRRFAAAGLVLGLIFPLELVLLAHFEPLRSSLFNHVRRSDGMTQLTLLGVIIAVAALIAGAIVLRRRNPGFPRVNLWFGFAVATSLVLGLGGLAWLPAFEVASSLTVLDGVFLLALVVGAPAGAIWVVWTLNRRSRWGVLNGYLALAPVYVYLAIDDATLERNTTVEEIAPAFPDAEASFEVLMRYGKRHPLGQFKVLQSMLPRRIWTGQTNEMSVDPGQPEKFRRLLLAKRADIEADWADLAPIRAWWDELAAFERIGDLTPGGWDVETMGFEHVRAYSRLASLKAGLQALDGQGDASFATLQPLLEVSRKLEPSSRTLVRTMVARSAQGIALDAAVFVLDTTPVSVTARARFATALSGGVGGEAGARRLIAIESARTMVVLEQPQNIYLVANQTLGRPLARALDWAGRLVYNPRRTSNVLGELVAEQQDLAARRDVVNIDTLGQRFFDVRGLPHFKNLLGGITLTQTTMTYGNVIKSYWTTEDTRAALLTRLTQR